MCLRHSGATREGSQKQSATDDVVHSYKRELILLLNKMPPFDNCLGTERRGEGAGELGDDGDIDHAFVRAKQLDAQQMLEPGKTDGWRGAIDYHRVAPWSSVELWTGRWSVEWRLQIGPRFTSPFVLARAGMLRG